MKIAALTEGEHNCLLFSIPVWLRVSRQAIVDKREFRSRIWSPTTC